MGKIVSLPVPPTSATVAPRKQSEVRNVARVLNRFLKGHRGVFGMALLMLVLEAITSIAAKFPIAWLLSYLESDPPSTEPIAVDLVETFWFLPPALIAAARDFVLGLSQRDVLLFLSVAILVVAVVNSISDSAAEIYLVKGGRRLGFQLREGLYAHLQKLSLAFFGSQRTGDLLSRVTSDVTAIEDFAVKSLKDIAGSVFLIAATLVYLFYSNWRMGLIAVVAVPLLSLASNYFAERIKAASKQQRAREGALAASAQEMLTSIRVIQIYGSAGSEQQRFAEQSQKAMDVAVVVGRLNAWFGGVISVLQAVVVVIIVWISVGLVSNGTIELGTTYLFIALIQELFKPTKRIIKQWNEVGRIIASTERIGEVLDRQPAVQDAPNAQPAPRLRGYIEFRQVSFAYRPDPVDAAKMGASSSEPRLALNNLSLSIAPGEVIALVGPSGAGKSTIVQLLPRLYDPHIGQVRIDGHNIREFTLDSLRSQMSMVLQEAILFAGTVANNIAYGRANASREEIIAAARQANAHEFIETLPDGYDTMLSERASNLSGGQRQRIAIARAFIRNTPILILDEPTTGLDAESSDLVLGALHTLMQGKTTLIISHDLNLIRDADRIVVIDAGRIAEIGTHDVLLKSGGLFANLHAKQFGPSSMEPARLAPQVTLSADADDEPAPLKRQQFQTLLLQAVPQPVTPQAFHTLTGPPSVAPTPAPQPVPAPQPSPVAVVPAERSVEQPIARQPAGEQSSNARGDRRSVQSIYHTATMPTVAPPEQSGSAVEPVMLRSAPPAASQPPAALVAAPPAMSPAREQAKSRSSAMPTITMPRSWAKQAPPRLEPGALDPMQSDPLLEALPTLPTAFDEDAMRERLQALLFTKRTSTGGLAYTIERCVIGQALYLAGTTYIVRYKLYVKDPLGRRKLEPTVIGRLFADRQGAEQFLESTLRPLAAAMRGRPEITAFDAPVALVADVNMAVSVFPVDGDLPTLVAATDGRQMVELFRTLLVSPDDGFMAEESTVQLLQYRRREQCVLRYEVMGVRQGNWLPERRLVIGRVAATTEPMPSTTVISTLQRFLSSRPDAFRFSLPQPLDYRPELQLALFEPTTGTPQMAQLLKARLQGKEAGPGVLSVEQALEATAHIAAVLHTSGITLGRRRTLADELDALRTQATDLEQAAPPLAAHLQEWLNRLEVYAEESDALHRCLNHGDFVLTQITFDADMPGLAHIDSACQAEPALDLGNFLASLRCTIRKTAPAANQQADELADRFVNTYLSAISATEEDAAALSIRIAIYELVSLVRQVIRRWHEFKPGDATTALAMLEERHACLP